MSRTLIFVAEFTKSKVKTTPANSPTIDIADMLAPTGSLLVSGGSPTQLTNLTGVYIYSYSAADAVLPVACMRTADTTVDLQDIPCFPLAFDGNGFVKADVEDWKGSAAAAMTGDAYAVVSNGTYGNSALKTLIDALPTAAAITTAVWAAGTRTLTSISALAASIASAVLDAVAASYNTSGTIGAKINAAGAASDPLENDVPGSYVSGTAGYVLGHLSDDGVTVISVLDGDDLTIRRGDTTTVNYTELGNISTRSALYFTLKQNLQGADSDARIQVTEAGGLVVLNGSASGLTASDASLTVTNATTGAVTLVLKPNLTKQLAAMDGLRWDVQMVASGAVTTLTEGDAEVVADVTRAVA